MDATKQSVDATTKKHKKSKGTGVKLKGMAGKAQKIGRSRAATLKARMEAAGL